MAIEDTLDLFPSSILGDSTLSKLVNPLIERMDESIIDNPLLILIAGALVIASWAILRYLRQQPSPIDSTEALFLELCKAHQIRSSRQALLERLATESDLEHPIALFISKQAFDQALNQAAQSMANDRKIQSKLLVVRRKIFATG